MKIFTKSGSVYTVENGTITGSHGVSGKLRLQGAIHIGKPFTASFVMDSGKKCSISTSPVTRVEY